jgi:hypothetical protein
MWMLIQLPEERPFFQSGHIETCQQSNQSCHTRKHVSGITFRLVYLVTGLLVRRKSMAAHAAAVSEDTIH